MKLIIASNNDHKVKEIRQILEGFFEKICSLKDENIDIEIEESGSTFEENALIKARAIRALRPECAVLADDSGLEVDALNGAPGVYSARFAKEQQDFNANNAKLLSVMADVPDEKRGCRFVCSIVLSMGEEELCVFGKCEGTVGLELKGSNGFGYDPLFFSTEAGKTFAQLTDEEKNAISHRSRALEAMLNALKEKNV